MQQIQPPTEQCELCPAAAESSRDETDQLINATWQVHRLHHTCWACVKASRHQSIFDVIHEGLPFVAKRYDRRQKSMVLPLASVFWPPLWLSQQRHSVGLKVPQERSVLQPAAFGHALCVASYLAPSDGEVVLDQLEGCVLVVCKATAFAGWYPGCAAWQNIKNITVDLQTCMYAD